MPRTKRTFGEGKKRFNKRKKMVGVLLDEDLERRLENAKTITALSYSDLVRHGLFRILSEIEDTGQLVVVRD